MPGADVGLGGAVQVEEAGAREPRPDVAQVIYNRLGQGIPLGIDATLADILSPENMIAPRLVPLKA